MALTSRSARAVLAVVGAAALALAFLAPAAPRTSSAAKYGGTLYVGLSNEPDALDPSTATLSTSVEVFRTICEKLYDFDVQGHVVPQLAAGLPMISKDKLTYTIPLRKGIVFNDGTPFDAQAVVATLRRHQTLPGSTRTSDLLPVARMTARSPSKVVLRLSSRYTPLTATLASSPGIIMSPAQLAKLGDRFAMNPVCVGPFMFDGRVAGDSITVVKSPYYHAKYAVYLDKIVFKVGSGAGAGAAMAAALKAGDLHVVDQLATSEVPGVQQASGVRLVQRRQLGWNGIVINIGNRNGMGNLPYRKVDSALASSSLLRKAFEEAIDRRTMARVVFGGLVDPGCTWVAPTSPLFDKSLRCTPYDPLDAKRLVAASGVAHPTVQLLVTSVPDTVRLAQFVKEQEAAVGIDVEIETAPQAIRDARATAGSFDAIVGGWIGNPDLDRSVFQFLHTSGSRNWGGYSNPRLDLILENSRKATSPTALKALYHAGGQIVLADRPIVYLYHSTRFAGVDDDVTGVQVGPDILVRVAFAQLR